jgi:hypothetical protein
MVFFGCMTDGQLWEKMQLYQLDDAGHLYISPAITDWEPVEKHSIDTIIDLDGDIDAGVPTHPDRYLYIYFPIFDEGLPNLNKLHGIATLGAALVNQGHRILSHCGLGFNRSALVGGLILNQLGYPGIDVLARIRERRPGALFNDRFADYLRTLPGPSRR